MTSFPYSTPRAFEAALTARFKAITGGSAFTLPQLRRQFAYDRLLARCFSGEQADQWVLKGGVSMLARLRIARHSADVDLATPIHPPGGFAALAAIVARDIGDFFSFDLAEPTHLVQGAEGIRVPVVANLGPRMYERFHIDLVAAATMTGEVESAPAIADPGIPGLVRPDYRIYPLADSVADKVCAILERHRGLPSTRFRDLVDLVLIARNRDLDARSLHVALGTERRRRALVEGAKFEIPDRAAWEPGYGKVVSRVQGLDGFRTLDQALSIVEPFVNPILTGARTTGHWDSRLGAWTD